MRIAVTGATGFVGSRLGHMLLQGGHEVVPISRRPVPGGVLWDPAAGRIDAGGLEGLDAVVHLAGENIAGRWTEGRKRRILESRVGATTLLASTLAQLARPPATLVSASAIGFYGAHDPDDDVDESSPAGDGFLARVTTAWEAATAPAAEAGLRVVHARLGMVVGRGGALGVMLPLFRIGLGGPVGSGEQMVSWIALDEIAPALLHVLASPGLGGAVNFTAPDAVSFNELARSLAATLHRPALFHVPAFAARIALGQMGVEVVLTGARVLPMRLLESGYAFRFPDLGGALRHALA